MEAVRPSLPDGIGLPGRRTLIKGGHVLSMDPETGNFAAGDVLLEGSRIVSVAAAIDAPGAAAIDATDKVVMPGFIDTIIICSRLRCAAFSPTPF